MYNKKILPRKNEIETLKQIIDNAEYYKENSENGLSIIVNGAWGSGKSKFINDLKSSFEQNSNEYRVLEIYNSFEYDFYENAYIPVFSFLSQQLETEFDLEKLFRITSSVATNKIINTSIKVIKGIFSKSTGIDIDDLKKIGDEYKKDIKKENDLYQDFKDLVEVKNNITKKIEKCTEEKTIILIIDELDRCNPRFAIDTLEILKHFLDIKNLIIILALDKEQLQESVKTIYGQNMKANIYFSKFFDYQFNLKKLELHDVVDCSDIGDAPQIIDCAQRLFDDLSISIRDSYKIMNEFFGKYKICNNDKYPWTLEQSYFILFMITLKNTDLLFYNNIIDGDFGSYYNVINNTNDIEDKKYIKVLNNKYFDNSKLHDMLFELATYKNEMYIEPNKMNLSPTPRNDTIGRIRDILQVMYVFIPYYDKEMTYKETLLEILK